MTWICLLQEPHRCEWKNFNYEWEWKCIEWDFNVENCKDLNNFHFEYFFIEKHHHYAHEHVSIIECKRFVIWYAALLHKWFFNWLTRDCLNFWLFNAWKIVAKKNAIYERAKICANLTLFEVESILLKGIQCDNLWNYFSGISVWSLLGRENEIKSKHINLLETRKPYWW